MRLRTLALSLAFLLSALVSPAAANGIGARAVYTDAVAAQAASWTDVGIQSGAHCVSLSSTCDVGTAEISFITVYSPGAASYLLLREADGEATSEAIFIPADGSISFYMYGTGSTAVALHGGGSGHTVYIVVGLR